MYTRNNSRMALAILMTALSQIDKGQAVDTPARPAPAGTIGQRKAKRNKARAKMAKQSRRINRRQK